MRNERVGGMRGGEGMRRRKERKRKEKKEAKRDECLLLKRELGNCSDCRKAVAAHWRAIGSAVCLIKYSMLFLPGQDMTRQATTTTTTTI
jgi:hypothetical protein